jgi:hypothetical protein
MSSRDRNDGPSPAAERMRRYRARLAGEDVPKRKPGPEPGVRNRVRNEEPAPPQPGSRRRPKNWDGKSNAKRLRETQAARAAAKRTGAQAWIEFTGFQHRLAQMCSVLESFRPGDLALVDEDRDLFLEHVETVYDDLISLGQWYDRTVMSLQGYLDSDKIRAKIAKLREAKGRTAEEAESMSRLAGKLERRLEAQLAAAPS